MAPSSALRRRRSVPERDWTERIAGTAAGDTRDEVLASWSRSTVDPGRGAGGGRRGPGRAVGRPAAAGAGAGAVLPAATASDAFAVLLAVVAITVLAAVLQPFQVRVVRLLEGYWSGWTPTARLAPVFVEFQRRRLHRLLERESELIGKIEVDSPAGGLTEQAAALRLDAHRRSELDRIRQRILRYPEAPVEGIHDPDDSSRPDAITLLPTALGNALRAGDAT